jgi:hypothetical protein
MRDRVRRAVAVDVVEASRSSPPRRRAWTAERSVVPAQDASSMTALFPPATRIQRSTVRAAPGDPSVIRRARSKDSSPAAAARREQRTESRAKGRQKRERRRLRDEKYDTSEVSSTHARTKIRQGRYDRADQRRRENEEAAAENAAGTARVAVERPARQAELSELQFDVPRAWSADAVPRLTALVGRLATLQNELEAAKQRSDALIAFAAPDAGGHLVAHHDAISTHLAAVRGARGACPGHLQSAQQHWRTTPADRYTTTRYLDATERLHQQARSDLIAAQAYIDPLTLANQADLTFAANYPNLKLTSAALPHPYGVRAHHPDRLADLNAKVANAQVKGWTAKGWPRSREAVRPGGPGAYMLPDIDVVVSNVEPSLNATGTHTLQIGPEIVIDWMYPNPAHGLKYSELRERVRSVLDTKNRIYQTFKPKIVRQANGNYAVECSNYAFQLILNPARDMIITYYTKAV